MRDLPYFKFWCQKVIPLVYDDSLSYYEVLCKVVEYINNLIDSDKEIIDNIEQLRTELATVQEWIDNFSYEPFLAMVKEMVEQYITAGVYFGLSDSGYFVAFIPPTWSQIQFRTTGLDIDLELQPEYGHLVLEY